MFYVSNVSGDKNNLWVLNAQDISIFSLIHMTTLNDFFSTAIEHSYTWIVQIKNNL